LLVWDWHGLLTPYSWNLDLTPAGVPSPAFDTNGCADSFGELKSLIDSFSIMLLISLMSPASDFINPAPDCLEFSNCLKTLLEL
jgi:hypothetical protein